MSARSEFQPLSRGERGRGEGNFFANTVAVVGVAAVTLLLAGCGERPQVIEYKQGKYQGKPDQPSWDSAKFNGNKNEWELAIKQRNQNQNEYKRTN